MCARVWEPMPSPRFAGVFPQVRECDEVFPGTWRQACGGGGWRSMCTPPGCGPPLCVQREYAGDRERGAEEGQHPHSLTHSLIPLLPSLTHMHTLTL